MNKMNGMVELVLCGTMVGWLGEAWLTCFSIMLIIMALATTVMTGPLVTLFGETRQVSRA